MLNFDSKIQIPLSEHDLEHLLNSLCHFEKNFIMWFQRSYAWQFPASLQPIIMVKTGPLTFKSNEVFP